MRIANLPFALLAWLLTASAGAMEVSTGRTPADCRYEANPAPAREEVEGFFLPSDHLFRPLLADLKEPRFYGHLRRVRFRTNPTPSGDRRKITAGVVGMGSNIGLWSQRRRGTCNGYQVGFFAAAFSQFNMSTSSDNLINTDYQVGFPLTVRKGALSARLRLYHQSSHLGDELLLNNPGITRENLSFEAVDVLGSVHGQRWRLYGAGAYRFRTETDIDRSSAQLGFELRWPRMLTHTHGVFGADFQAFAEQDWAVTTSLVAGPEFDVPNSNQRVRILALYLNGFIPFGQFFNETRLENYGVGFQFDF
ncbi:DUF1207 domain-containing protein [Thiohalorhabdus sp.]|uniref:DUF1207 domain-containing protein n=1 Tax=Thiohalorhabdus sp. TaxID=3094134 RepID=UPI002FC3332C